jgi:membrane protease YdiL (CAAX protease family)
MSVHHVVGKSKQDVRADGCWRELLFWFLLLPAMGALGSASPRREAAGLIEAGSFFSIAVCSLGKLRNLGLGFVRWNRISRSAVAVCTLAALLAGGAIVAIAKLSNQRIGAEAGWNRAVLAIVIGPISEEVIFRGYMLALALWLTRHLAKSRSAAVSVTGIAVLFALAHLATPGITGLQLCCVTMTGCLYGWIRVRYCSTAAAALAHGMYNFALFVSYWCGLS